MRGDTVVSKWRDKAREVKEAAEEERSNFQPREGSVPLKMYRYWEGSTGAIVERENFCHYWRVVFIWAPLTWVWDHMTGVYLSVIAAGVVAVVSLATGSWVPAAIAAGFAWVFGGLRTGAMLYTDQVKATGWRRKLLLTAGFPWWCVTKIKIPDKVVGWLVGAVLGAATVLWIVAGTVQVGWWFPVVLAGAVVAIGVLISGVVWLINVMEARRNEAFMERKRRAEETGDWSLLYERRRAKAPGRLARAWSGFIDVLLLGAQVVRVKKWKICPTVTIPEERQSD